MSNDQKELMDVVVDYAYALDTLDDYDYQRLGVGKTTLDGRGEWHVICACESSFLAVPL